MKRTVLYSSTLLSNVGLVVSLFIALIFSISIYAGEKNEGVHDQSYRNAYPNGDFYFLIGNLDPQHKITEFMKFAGMARYLSNKGFRIIMNPQAYRSDLHEAITNPNTTAIIWSSHGAEKKGTMKKGTILDSGNVEIPTDIFEKNPSDRLKMVIFSNCHGDCTIKSYRFKGGTNLFFFSGPVSTVDLFDFLRSEQFDKSLTKAVGPLKNKCASIFMGMENTRQPEAK